MKRLLLALAIAALALPAAALGKGPTAAMLEGPGTDGISFAGYDKAGPDLGELTQQAGLWATVFGQSPDPRLPGRPDGDLGPRFTLTYTVPGAGGDDLILQDVYPYATPAPVTYTAPGQKIFDRQTLGGWVQAGPDLKTTLVSAGLPSTASATSRGTSLPTSSATLLVLAALFVAATALLLRRRARAAPAA
ncbi:MAG TPA: hypothetical protein VF236_07560 [Gaiellaceae bacterium]